MSYEKKIDEMVGKHVAEFLDELSLARIVGQINHTPPMPYGYPMRIYHPCHPIYLTKGTKSPGYEHQTLSNGVPWVLGMDLDEDYILGLYNPPREASAA